MTDGPQQRAVAVVFETEWRNGLALARALGRAGVLVYGLSTSGRSLGFRSRFVRRRYIHPDPEKSPDDFISFLRELGLNERNLGRTIIPFPTSDLLVSILSARRQELEGFLFPFPEWPILAGCLDKQRQVESALAVGVPVPNSYASTDLVDLDRDLRRGRTNFPLVLKRRESFTDDRERRYRVVRIEDGERLDSTVAEVSGEGVPFLIQEVIPGGDDTLFSLGSYVNRAGNFLSAFVGRKLRQKPPVFGIARVAETANEPDLLELGGRLLRDLSYFGISQVEFKFDHRDGRFKLIEVNPRSWSWIGLAEKSGINIPFAAFRDTIGDPMEPEFGSGNYRWICITDDLVASLKYRDAIPLLSLFHPVSGWAEAYLSFSDPLPGLTHLWQEGLGVLQGSMFGKR